MRNILNISLPEAMVRSVKQQMKEGNFASVSEYIRHVIRKYDEMRLLEDIKQSEAEFASGKGKVLRSLKDLR